MEIKDKLKAIRKKLGLSQLQLSTRLLVTRGYISELEIGVKKPSKELKKKINRLYRKWCVKKEPLVEVLTPQVKKTLWERFIDRLKGLL